MFIVKLHKPEFEMFMYLGGGHEAVSYESEAKRFNTRAEADAAADAYQKHVARRWRTVPLSQVLEVK